MEGRANKTLQPYVVEPTEAAETSPLCTAKTGNITISKTRSFQKEINNH